MWATHKLENNCITEVLPQEWDFWADARFSSLRVWHQKEEPPEHLTLRPAGIKCRRSKELEETKTPLLVGAHTVSCASDPRQKQWLHRSLGQTYLLVLERLLRRRENIKSNNGKPTNYIKEVLYNGTSNWFLSRNCAGQVVWYI